MALTRKLTEGATVIFQEKWRLNATISQPEQLKQNINGKEGTGNLDFNPTKTRIEFQTFLGPWWEEWEHENGERKSLRVARSFEGTTISHIDESLNNKGRASA